MTTNIPIAFITAVSYDPDTSHYNCSADVWVQSQKLSPTYRQSQESGMIWVCALDRKTPTNPAPFNQILASNTDVPAALAAVLDDNHIVLVSICGPQYSFPQGALFAALIKAGAGDKLRRMERLATYSACGLSETARYALVTVPGVGIQGIENIGRTAVTISTQMPEKYGITSSVENMMLDLEPTIEGYVPVLIG